MARGKFRRPPQSPPSFTHTPEGIRQDAERIVKRNKALQDRIVEEMELGNANFRNVILHLAQDDDKMNLEARILGFYQAVSPDVTLRDASTDAAKMIDSYSIESSSREDFFRLVKEIYRKQSHDESLDGESRRLLDKEYKAYVKMGLEIGDRKARERFKSIQMRLTELSITFQRTLNEEQGGLWLSLAELEGVPQHITTRLRPGEIGSEDEGKLWLTFKYPDIIPAMKYCKNAQTRRRVFLANENKCNQNTDVFKETIVLRDEAARLLGYPDHAALAIEDKMAQSPQAVHKFLDGLQRKLASGAMKEVKQLKKLKANEQGIMEAENYYLWDNSFYDTLLLYQNHNLDQDRVAEYFPLQTTISGMLGTFEHLFGLVFLELDAEDRDAISPSGNGKDITWHEDVQMFSVWNDEDGDDRAEFVGYLYLDLYPRDGKYAHAANFNIQPGFLLPSGERRYPATALVCNFNPPTPQKPSLLQHREIVTLFHELGHGIHDLVSRTKYSRFHGTNTVQDFVEAPSQMLENWCWNLQQIKSLSRHWSYLSLAYKESWRQGVQEHESHTQPEEQIPTELAQSIISTRHVNDALFYLRQLHYGLFDMAVHTAPSHSHIQALDPTDLYNRLRSEISHLQGPEIENGGDFRWGHGQATFGHLLGGYDAGYYGYLSSQVYSTDMFHSVFKRDPMNREEGRRYRRVVLEKGGSRDEMEMLEEFLGRRPSLDAFYAELGLS